MYKLFFLALAITTLFSCSKDEKPDPQRDAFAAIRGKYLVCESVVTTINGRNTTQILGKGKGRDMNFGLYGNLDIYTTPVTTKNYQFESPDKIYYWTNTFDSNQYYTVQSLNGNKLVLVERDPSGLVLTEYFTAE